MEKEEENLPNFEGFKNPTNLRDMKKIESFNNSSQKNENNIFSFNQSNDKSDVISPEKNQTSNNSLKDQQMI